MRASDMDENTKRAILDKIRDEVGSYKYSEMVDKIGEDGLIDLLLSSAEKEQKGKENADRISKKGKANWFWIAIVIVLALYALCWLFDMSLPNNIQNIIKTIIIMDP